MVKTVVACLAVVASNVIGNYALKRGLSHTGMGATWSPMPYIHAFSHLWVDVGVLSMAAWFITRLALLSWADLSYVLPVCSFSYVLSAVAGAVMLGEHVPWLHWVGTCIVSLGVAVTALTFPETTHNPGQVQ
jgi:uncharacterized membrane protein